MPVSTNTSRVLDFKRLALQADIARAKATVDAADRIIADLLDLLARCRREQQAALAELALLEREP